MQKEELYKNFATIFAQEILPYIESKFRRSSLTLPVYHIIDNFHLCRFRSALPLIIASGFNLPRGPFRIIGAAAELGFAKALVEDDIIDEDEARGSIQSSHCKFGYPKTTVAIGLASNAIENILSGLEKEHVPYVISKKIRDNFKLASDQVYCSFYREMTYRYSFPGCVSNDRLPLRLEEIHKAKTAHGTAAIVCTGMLMTDQVKERVKALKNFSEELGVAGQIKNDIYDITRYTTAQSPSSDLRNGYVTVPIVFFLQNQPADERKKILRSLRERKETEDLLKCLNNSRAVTDSIKLGKKYVARAKTNIVGLFPENIERLLLCWADAHTLPTNPDQALLKARYPYRTINS